VTVTDVTPAGTVYVPAGAVQGEVPNWAREASDSKVIIVRKKILLPRLVEIDLALGQRDTCFINGVFMFSGFRCMAKMIFIGFLYFKGLSTFCQMDF
jgi:hypothetical protein